MKIADIFLFLLGAGAAVAQVAVLYYGRQGDVLLTLLSELVFILTIVAAWLIKEFEKLREEVAK